MKIAVIDGQGGGIGRSVVEKLKKELTGDNEIIALGTNSAATVVMLKAGAGQGASGENAIVYNAGKVDIIIGPIGIIIPNAMMGELTPSMARAIAESPAKKILIPFNKCNIEIAGLKGSTIPSHIEDAISMMRDITGNG